MGPRVSCLALASVFATRLFADPSGPAPVAGGDDPFDVRSALRWSAQAREDTMSNSVSHWFPMEVHRWTMAELEDTSIHGLVPGPSAPGAKDTSKLHIEGSKTISVGVGGSGGVALDQSLLLTADGDLAPGIHLKAKISDGNLPLSSQGSSAPLRDVDELWLEVFTDHWDTRLGDQDWITTPGLGAGYQLRVRGWSGTWNPDGGQAKVMIGGPQARWTRVVLSGVDGQQEGYVLVKASTNPLGAIVPGSETVRVNGQLMTRGGDADYSVRYSQGLLDFTTRRRILASDVIEVEFQAADLDYEETFAAASVKAKVGAWSMETWAMRLADQGSNPLSYAPDSSTQRILAAVGSDSTLALNSAGNQIPLPKQTGEAGFRLNWGDSTTWVRSDLRGSSLDQNVLSSRASTVSGVFGAAEAGTRLGDYLTSGGTGLWTVRTRGEELESTYHGLSGPDTLGSASSDWAGDRSSPSSGRTDGLGALSWELARGIGIWSSYEAKEEGPAYLSLATGTVGLDQGKDRQILTKASWSERDDGVVPLDYGKAMARATWPFGAFAPRVEADGEIHDTRGADSADRRFSRWALAGGNWKDPTGWSLDLQWLGRDDATDLSGTVPGGVDTARSLDLKGAVKWTAAQGSIDLDADWTQGQNRLGGGDPWVQTATWLGEATGMAAPVKGLRGTAHWRLSTSSFQPELPAYDTVPAGTGAFIYDSTLREVVPSDEGNLRWVGSQLDTSRPPVHASTRALDAELEVVPGNIVKGLKGFLADIGGRLRGALQQTDSSAAVKIVPDFSDAGLERSAQAQSSVDASLWWTLDGKRLEGSWNRQLAVGQTTTGVTDLTTTERLDWTSTLGKANRLELIGEHGSDQETEPGYQRDELRWRGEPSLGIQVVKTVEVKPGYVVQTGSGQDNGTAFTSLEQAPYVDVNVQFPHNLRLRSELRRATADVNGPVGSQLTDDDPAGTTWRATAGLDWSWKDHVQAHADWTLRLQPNQAPFQKLSIDARANF